MRKGFSFALAAAFISGVSVFLNKFASNSISNPYVLTTVKNLFVALVLSLFIVSPFIVKKLKAIKKGDWVRLVTIGFIGGSIPFLMFFKGLSLATSVNAAVIHKTLFVWVSLLALTFLKEKIGKMQLFALLLLIVGNYLLSGFKSFQFGSAELLILGATLFWSIEYIVAKKVLRRVEPEIVAWARMFFGAIIMLVFLMVTGSAGLILQLPIVGWQWIIVTSVLLLGYVYTWAHALKRLPASVFTSILVIAVPITTVLNKIFIQGNITFVQWLGIGFVSSAVYLLFDVIKGVFDQMPVEQKVIVEK